MKKRKGEKNMQQTYYSKYKKFNNAQAEQKGKAKNIRSINDK